MTLLGELCTLLAPIISVETGVYSDTPPDRYVVMTPIADTYGYHADNRPRAEVQEVRLSLYDRGNYTDTKNRIITALLNADITITGRSYIGHEDDTGYHHYAIDAAKEYEVEE